MVLLSKQNKQVILLYGSTIVGLLVGMLNSVLNTRSLSPELYGDVRYVQNIISFVSSLLLVGFFISGSRLLALSKSEEQSRKIRGVMIVILGIAICLMMLTLTVLFAFSKIAGQQNLTLLYLVAIPVCGNALMLDYVNTTAQGDNHIGRIAIARCIPPTLYLIVAFVLYKLFGATPVRMLILYNGIAVLVLAVVIFSTNPKFQDLRDTFKLLKIENKEYGFNVYLGACFNVSTQYLAGIALGHFCADNSGVGFYTLSLMLATPLAMLPSIIGTTFFKQFAVIEKIPAKVLLSSIAMTLFSLVVFIICIKFLVQILYDQSYSSVSIYSSFLAIGTSIHGLGDIFNRFLGSHGLGKEIRNGAISSGIVVIIGNFLLVGLWGIYGAIITKILSDLVYGAAMLFGYRSFRKKS